MGVWGSGLYSGDFALDLRATIGAVVRLPFDPDRLVEILCESEPRAANDPNDEDHTTFWLIVADQFAKRGIVCDRVREKALDIINGGKQLAMLRDLGMQESDLRKRHKLLQEVRTRIVAANVGKPRTVLRKPQPLLMDLGDVIAYPTRRGGCINPYYATIRMVNGRPWIPDGWAAAVILECGRAFEFLSWYRPLTLAEARSGKPVLDSLRGEVLWRLQLPGTCSAIHFKRMELEKIGNLPVDSEKVIELFRKLNPGTSAAISNISIANSLKSAPCMGEPTKIDARTGIIKGVGWDIKIIGIEQILGS